MVGFLERRGNLILFLCPGGPGHKEGQQKEKDTPLLSLQTTDTTDRFQQKYNQQGNEIEILCLLFTRPDNPDHHPQGASRSLNKNQERSSSKGFSPPLLPLLSSDFDRAQLFSFEIKDR
jgi:hypothetical protein